MNDWLAFFGVFLGIPLAIMLYGLMGRRSKKKKWTEAWFNKTSSLVGRIVSILIILTVAMVWLGELLMLSRIFGYLALLGCSAYIARNWKDLVKKPFFTNLNLKHLVLAIIIFCSLFLIVVKEFSLCLNPPYGPNC